MKNFAYDMVSDDLDKEVQRLANIVNKKKLMAKAYIVTLTELFYEVWVQGSMKMYQDKAPNVKQAVRNVIFKSMARLPDQQLAVYLCYVMVFLAHNEVVHWDLPRRCTWFYAETIKGSHFVLWLFVGLYALGKSTAWTFVSL